MNKEEAKKFLENHGYNVKQFLGEGSFSKVFKCANPKKELVAAKVICVEDEQQIQREINTAKEIEAAKPLDFSKYKFEFSQAFKQRAKNYYKYLNVPTVKEFSGGTFNVVVEAPLVDSDTWKSIIEGPNEGKVPYDKFKQVAKSVLKALTVLNARGIAHFDIKPENIYQCTSASGITKFSLGDFGLSGETIDPKTEQEEYRRKGSPDFAAPELFGSKLDQKQIKKVDVYSLGATLFLMFLAKKKDFINANQLPNAIKRLQSGTIYANTNKEIKRKFLDFVKYCTTPNPAQRPTPSQALTHPFLT